MRFPWLEGRDRGALWNMALLPLDGAALWYGSNAWVHRTLYERGALPRRRLSCRVVSVGSLTIGGSGKTPCAAWLAARLHARGHRVVLASRGYKRSRGDRVEVVSDGKVLRGSLAGAGDEPLLLVSHAPEVPVLVGPDRGVVGLRAISAFGAEVLVLDDGFQHHRLARDVDIVTFDGVFGFGNRRVLPRGPLREWSSSLSRADAVGVLDAPLADADETRVVRSAPQAFRFRGRRRPVGLRALEGGPTAPPEILAGTEVGMLAAIGQPQSFRRTLEGLGARVVAERTFRDHHSYRPADLRGLSKCAPIWVTTEKDAVKIPPVWAGRCDLRVLRIDLDVKDPAELLDWLEDRLRNPAGRALAAA